MSGKSPARRGASGKIEPGASEHYSDAAYYAVAYRKRTRDVAFYEDLVVRDLNVRPALRVLEYGAGSGRITLPLARRGVQITAVDTSQPMLRALRESLKAAEPEVRRRVKVRRGDMRSLRLAERFDLVIAPFNTLLHLYTRQDAEHFLARVSEHLSAEGRLVFDYSLPSLRDLPPDPERWFKGARFRHPRDGQLVSYAERFHYAPLSQVLSIWMRFTPLDPALEAWETRLSHRQFFPQELGALLHYNGFTEQTWTADFEGTPVRSTSDTAVVECWRSPRIGSERRNLPPSEGPKKPNTKTRELP